FSCILFIGATNSYSQETTFTLNLKSTSIKQVCERIEKESDFLFVFAGNAKKMVNKKIDLSINSENIEDVLTNILLETNLTYQILDKQIVIYQADNKNDLKEVLKSQQQKRTIKGFVKDEKGEPIPYAYVLVKGSSVGTSTMEDGSYEIAIPEDVVLIYTYIGYTSMEIPTKGRTAIDVILKEDNIGLDEVVVTGYNTVERRHIASAIESVNMSSVETRPLFKLQEAFGGTVPGVVLNRSTSIPGGSSSINIRGVGTLQSSTPLVIVDGVEQSMADLDPTQIQSMTVLKDAASTSMYGSRGANGVVVIETKRGETSDFKVNVNAWSAVNLSIEKPDFVNGDEYIMLVNEARTAQGQELLSESREGDDVNWLDAVTPKTAYAYNATANITGGGGVGRFSLMLGYNKEEGETGLEGSNKFSARFNTNINLAEKIIIMADFYAHRLNVDRGYDGDADTPYEQAWQMNPTQQIYWDDDIIQEKYKHYRLYNDINPVAYINAGGWKKNIYDRITINLRPRYYILPELYIAGDLSYMIEKSANKYERMTYKFFDGDKIPSTVWNHSVDASQGVSESQLTARGTINYESALRGDKDKLYAVAGSEVMSNVFTNYTEYTKASFFGKVTYSFDNRYILEGTLRGDGNSKFAPKKRWGIFPSVSAGWNLQNESFMSDIVKSKVLNTFKIRASWGRIGNENVDPYLWQEVVNTWGWTMRVPNPNFSWEKQQQFNVGIDYGFFNNRLTGSFDVYDKYSTDLIWSNFSVPPLTGSYYLVTSVNIGEVSNKGWESSVKWSDKVGDFRYSLGLIFFDNKNTIEKVGYTDDAIINSNLPYDNQIWRKGDPLNNFYGYQSQGYFQSEEEIATSATISGKTYVGDVKYVDRNNDGSINDEDKIILGDASPRYNYSISVDLGYKNWDFAVLGTGVGKRDGAILGLEGQPVIVDGSTNALGTPRRQYLEGRWTSDNPNSRFPRMWSGISSNSAQLSDVWMSDASYFRIRSLQIGYTFDKKIFSKSLSNLRIYANAENFLTITNWEGLEPERIRGGNGVYPMMATYSLGIQATF
ncbi:MAG: TonB-dependent receptor, partial [Massilibacteroides sp.]|nr:TonB-dependent receptor [Massilibacteroides sp.]